jgi:hypothetical protein
MPYKDKLAERKYQREFYQRVRKAQRTERKLKLLEMLGGKCTKCGYDKCPAALHFHHEDPSQKDFTIAGTFRAFEKDLAEARKCIILCANCHAEQHFLAEQQVSQLGYRAASTSSGMEHRARIPEGQVQLLGRLEQRAEVGRNQRESGR